MVVENEIISGKPSKEFFINMITRDLSIIDCILDLIDNSVDKAVDKCKADVMKTLTNEGATGSLEGMNVWIKISPKEFIIQDNCGGISIKEAREIVFRFGNPEIRRVIGGLSVYGIGMKRAFFRLGHEINMHSITDHEWWKTKIDVEEWKNKGDDDWSFKFTETGTNNTIELPGTIIKITNLRDEILPYFKLISFQQQLRHKIGMTYALFIKAGLSIYLNDNLIEMMLPSYGFEEKITPARKMISYDSVDILIIAGVTGREDRTPRGWYIFCNGRMVLEADQSEDTGWGTGLLPKWHTKFGHFVGYVYFRSDDVRKLPWTTTKQKLVVDSQLYQAALKEMQIQSRPVLDFLSNMYPGEVVAEGLIEREVLEKTQNRPIIDIPKLDSVFFVNMKEDKQKAENRLVSIQYKKRKKEIDLIKSCDKKLKWATNKEIGEYTFDYFIDRECE